MDGIEKPQQKQDSQRADNAPARSFIKEAQESVALNTARNQRDIRDRIEKGKRRIHNGAVQTPNSKSANLAVSPSGSAVGKVQPSPGRTAKRRSSVRIGTPMKMAARAAMRGMRARQRSRSKPKNEEKSVFPYSMFIFAMVVDSLELLSFGILGVLTTPIFFLSFWLWLITKSSVVRKRLWKKAKVRLIGSAVAESLPIVGTAPMKSLMVWTVYKKGELNA